MLVSGVRPGAQSLVNCPAPPLPPACGSATDNRASGPPRGRDEFLELSGADVCSLSLRLSFSLLPSVYCLALGNAPVTHRRRAIHFRVLMTESFQVSEHPETRRAASCSRCRFLCAPVNRYVGFAFSRFSPLISSCWLFERRNHTAVRFEAIGAIRSGNEIGWAPCLDVLNGAGCELQHDG